MLSDVTDLALIYRVCDYFCEVVPSQSPSFIRNDPYHQELSAIGRPHYKLSLPTASAACLPFLRLKLDKSSIEISFL